jgi:hypothetical protein
VTGIDFVVLGFHDVFNPQGPRWEHE